MDNSFTAAHRRGTGAPLLLLHGFTDTWRTWELILEDLQRDHDVFAPTLPCHAGGPMLADPTLDALADAVEDAMNDAGLSSAHVVGNSLGGFLAVKMATRGRALSVLGLAPAGGWPVDDELTAQMHAFFRENHARCVRAAPRAREIMSTPEGRRKATQFMTVAYEHIPAELLVHQLIGVAQCDVPTLLDHALGSDWTVDGDDISCPVRIVWGRNDVVLPWPRTATRYQDEWTPQADWVLLDDCGHLPQLDRPAVTAKLVREWTAENMC